MPADPESAWWSSGRITWGSLPDKHPTASGSFIAAMMEERFARGPDRSPARSRSGACSERTIPLAGAAVVVGQACAAALGEVTGKAPVELAGTAVAELIRTAWRLAPRGRNSVAARGYPSVAGTVI